jgi:hypothetical protein
VPRTGFDPHAHGFHFVFVYDSHHPDTEIVLGLEAGGRLWEASDGFGTIAGSYAVAAGYLSEQGCWLTIPRASRGRSTRSASP